MMEKTETSDRLVGKNKKQVGTIRAPNTGTYYLSWQTVSIVANNLMNNNMQLNSIRSNSISVVWV